MRGKKTRNDKSRTILSHEPLEGYKNKKEEKSKGKIKDERLTICRTCLWGMTPAPPTQRKLKISYRKILYVGRGIWGAVYGARYMGVYIVATHWPSNSAIIDALIAP